MRTLIVSEFVTLDGVMEAPGGEPSHPHTGWVVPWATPDLFAYKLAEVLAAESLLLGRVTYESFAGSWPDREGEFAEKMNSMPKQVATSRPAELGWHATALEGDVPTAGRRLKETDGGPLMVHGSGTLVRALLAAGLVDELRLMVFPVAIGGGLRVFPEDRGKIELRLDDVSRFDGGVVLMVHRRV